MRLIIFSSHYLPYMGGVENFTEHLSDQLLKDGHQVVLVTSEEMKLPRHEIKENGLEIYRLPSLLLLKGGRYPILEEHAPYTRKVWKKLSREHFDLCLINTRFYIMTLFGLKFGNANHIRTIVMEHGTSHLSVHIPSVDRLGEKWEHWLTDQGKKYHAEYYGVSKASCRWLEHFNIRSSGVIYNAIDLNEVERMKEEKKEDYRHVYGIQSDDMVVTFTGRMIEEKGVLQLMEAAENILHTRNDVYFFFAGDGVLLEQMKARAEKTNGHVICLGRIDADHIISLLDQSDIFCLPSFSEGFSTSVLEAAACRAYIITTYRGGSRELITDKSLGCIIPDNRLEYVQGALENALDHPEMCREAAENCYKRLAEHFTWKQSAQEVEKLMRSANVQAV